MNLTDIPFDQRQDLLAAALGYAAVADWFESRPCRWQRHLSLPQAMAHFDCAEAQLRAACDRVLRSEDHRKLLLEAAGVPATACTPRTKTQGARS